MVNQFNNQLSFYFVQITDDSLIYTNLLIFTPQPSSDGVVHLEQAVVPIECYYSR